jgi:hypothetical protein
MNNLAPIALFVYNRPKHTQQTVEALLLNPQARETDLYIFSDAAKNEATQTDVNLVRNYINQISGFNKVEIVERTTNWGLANSVIDGVTRLCKDFGKVIVLEDDLVISPHFLEFMNAGLDKYQSDEKVMQIAGYMFPVKLDISEDALFMPLTSSWGWATWHRAWQHFDPSAKGYYLLGNNAKLKKAFDLGDKYPYFKMLESQRLNKVDSWAIRWYLSVFLLNGLVLYPRKSLVDNNGFDGSGVNCIASGFGNTYIDKEFIVNVMPENTEISGLFDEIVHQLPKPKLSIKSYLKRLRKAFKIQ